MNAPKVSHTVRSENPLRAHVTDFSGLSWTYRIVAATRSHPRLTLGASPRAGVHLLTAAQANAAIEGRDFATPDDVKGVAAFVIPHRLIVAPDAEIEGIAAADVLREVLASVPVPAVSP